MTSSAFTPRRALLAIALLSILGVAAALTGQYAYDMRPCPWCILQRVLFILIALLSLVAASARSRPTHLLQAGVVIVLAALGSSAALYQHFVAAKSDSCALTLADKIITALGLEAMMPSLFQITGSCADAAVSVLGISFDIWSLMLFFIVAAMALAAITMRRR